MRPSVILGLALWVGFAPSLSAGETRVVSVPTAPRGVPLSAAEIPSLPTLTPLDVRDAALPELPPALGVGLQPAPLARLETAVAQAQLGGAVLQTLRDLPVQGPQKEIDPGAVDALFNGNSTRVSLLDGALEAVDARSDMIHGAQRTVFAAYYRFHTDAAGYVKLALLRDAARRGRDVRLVLDPWGSGIPKAMLRHLVDEGVKIRFFHPPSLKHMSWLLRRSHDKFTIVDGKAAVLGDRNIGDHYFGMGQMHWTSREAYVEGQVAAQAQGYALSLWDSGELGAPRGLDRAAQDDVAKARAKLDVFSEHLERRRENGGLALRPWLGRARTMADARFSHNTLGTRRGISGTGLDLLRMIRGAEKTIVIENSYVVLPEVFKREIRRAIKERGVRVVLLTNSPKTNNLFWPRIAYEADLPDLVKMGVELWEFNGPGTLHAKTMVVDGRKVYLGSFNLDPRSLKLNTETGLVAEDAGLARDLLGQVRGTQANATLVGFRGRLLVERTSIPVLSRIWRMLRRLLLLAMREQV